MAANPVEALQNAPRARHAPDARNRHLIAKKFQIIRLGKMGQWACRARYLPTLANSECNYLVIHV
jgi:hypothetical protein